MMKKIIIYLIALCFFSCTKENIKEEYYPDGSVKVRIQTNKEGIYEGIYEEFYEDGILKTSTIYKNGSISDTIFYYHKNGKLKSKGLQEDNLPVGWWSHYDMKGNLTERREIKIIDNKRFLNQEIKYNQKGEIDYSESSFFTLLLSDTLILGGNKGELYYPPDTLGFEQRFIRIIIDNQYTEGLIKKDTFVGRENTNWFGVYGNKLGKKRISGIVEQELIFINKINKDSTVATVNTKKKYFEKEVYVKEK